jgi:hypothetical protein
MMMLLETSFLCPGVDGRAHITSNAVQCECGNRNIQSLARILDRQPYTAPVSDFAEYVCLFVDNYRDEPGLGINPEYWD